jgi:hypothetical protein
MIASSYCNIPLQATLLWDGASLSICRQWKVAMQLDSPADGRGITDSVWAATSANEAIIVITIEVVSDRLELVLPLCYFWMGA